MTPPKSIQRLEGGDFDGGWVEPLADVLLVLGISALLALVPLAPRIAHGLRAKIFT